MKILAWTVIVVFVAVVVAAVAKSVADCLRSLGEDDGLFDDAEKEDDDAENG